MKAIQAITFFLAIGLVAAQPKFKTSTDCAGRFCEPFQSVRLGGVSSSRTFRCYFDEHCPAGLYCDQADLKCVSHLRGPRRLATTQSCLEQVDCPPGWYCNGFECYNSLQSFGRPGREGSGGGGSVQIAY
ncbi:hypothetical protein MVEG_00237 [Podila verticillata NRRL 6337]|nr:hypothetical protein MVEG_00237 [Podila verticillata NRRL 6337]